MKLKTFEEYISENVNNLEFKKSIDSTDQDRIVINAFLDNEEIGSLIFQLLFNAYEIEFSYDFTEDEFDSLFSDDVIVKLEHIEIDDEFKGQGIATKLMNYGMSLMKEKGYVQFYLNASPMGFRGLDVNNLVRFYKKIGFETILDQGDNVQMAYTI